MNSLISKVSRSSLVSGLYSGSDYAISISESNATPSAPSGRLVSTTVGGELSDKLCVMDALFFIPIPNELNMDALSCALIVINSCPIDSPITVI